MALSGANIRTPDGEAPLPPRISKREFWTLIGLGIAAAAVLALILVPVPQPSKGFTLTLSSTPSSPGVEATSFPPGSQVSGHWNSTAPVATTVEIVDAIGTLVYVAVGSAGSFSFVAGNSPYLFSSISVGNSTSVTVVGTYTTAAAPLL